jgi:hypothetical protein
LRKIIESNFRRASLRDLGDQDGTAKASEFPAQGVNGVEQILAAKNVRVGNDDHFAAIP